MSLLSTSPCPPTTSPATSQASLPAARATETRARGPFRVRTGLRAGDVYMHNPPGSNDRNRTR